MTDQKDSPKILPNDIEIQKQDGQSNKENDKQKTPPPAEMVSFWKLLSFTTSYQRILLVIGGIAAAGNGVTMPFFSMVFGQMTDAFSPTSTGEEVVRNAGIQALYFLLLGVISFLCSWVQFYTWMWCGEIQSIEFRRRYFEAVLRQEIGWFDKMNPSELATQMAQQVFAIQGAIGEKVPTFIMTIFMTIGGFIVGYIRGWELSLVLTAVLPLIAMGGFLMTVVMQNSTTLTEKTYSQAGGIAEQAITSIKTVKSLGGEEFECGRYNTLVYRAMNETLRYSKFVGLSLGFMMFSMFIDNAIGFYYGSVLIENQYENKIYGRPYSAGDVLVIFFAMQIGGFSMGQAAPCLTNFQNGKIAGHKVFSVLERTPNIKNDAKGVTIPKEQFTGKIHFQNVNFSYPSKQDITVLKDVTFTIEAGQKTSIVGESGSGKSTCLQLIERFYEVNSGSLLLDGKRLDQVDLHWLRDNIGYVGQEPVLFATSIRENLRYGKKNATEQEMWDALEKASAKKFVEQLQDSIDTFVGSAGNQLSGGQKQRICIARAILKDPKILLLDEATSALDRANEMSIQKTLDEVSKGRTTIVIAHRISTVMNSDKIIVLDKGVIVESGRHQEMINAGGKYEALAKNQVQGDIDNALQLITQFSLQKATESDLVKVSDSLQYLEFEATANKQNLHNFLETQMGHLKYEHFLKNSNLRVREIDSQLENRDLSIQEILEQLLKAKQLQENQQKDKVVDKEEAKKKQQQSNASSKEEQKKKPELSKEEKQKLEKEDKLLMARLYSYNQPEKMSFYLGIVCALCNGTLFPILAWIMSELIWALADFYNPDVPVEEFRRKCNNFTYGFIGLSVACFFFFGGQAYFFSKVGEGLTYRLRLDLFKKIVRMPTSWFDEPLNNPGSLAVKLSSEAQLVNNLTSNVVGLQISNMSSMFTGMFIAFYFAWSITLVSIGLSPIMILAGQIQAQSIQGFSESSDDAYKDSGNLIQEAVTNIRTVASFGNEHILLGFLNERLKKPESLVKKKSSYSGIAFGFSQMAMFLIYGLTFFLGAIFNREYGLNMRDMMASIFAIMYASFGAGNNNQFMVDIGQAKNAAKNMFKILDSLDEFQIHERDNKKYLPFIQEKKIRGDIEFRDVVFKYPLREKIILDKVSFSIKSGQKAAFVGPSGCGKSTIMQLLMRFYDIQEGEILLDGKDIRSYDIKTLRSYFGVVSQEPAVFNGTIRDNIQYNTEGMTEENIKSVAAKANALKFIMEDYSSSEGKEKERGFEKQVGSKGTQISGGQKQRIAIARAIAKNPQILLLDEATSALDAENEKVVQESLDNIMKDKTTLAIAHRLSTIKDSDIIFVIEDGIIVEQGVYQQLVQMKGYFYRLEKGSH